MEVSTVYRRSPDVIERSLLEQTLLVPIRGELADLERVFALNAVAQHIWEQIDGERDLAALRDSVVARFEVDAARAEADVAELLAELSAAGLVVEVP